MWSVERARKAETEKWEEEEGGGEGERLGSLFLDEGEEFWGPFLEEEVARKERREARVKKRRGAEEEEESRDEGEEGEGEEHGGEEEEAGERREVVGSRELWRWRRFDNISMKVSSIEREKSFRV